MNDLAQTNYVPAPEWVATWSGTHGENIYGVHVANQKAYLAANESGLIIIDLSQPSKPVELGRYDTAGLAQCVQVVGNYAYVADGTNGLQIIDISTPSNPSLVGNVPALVPHGVSFPFTRQVSVEGQYAYMADGVVGMQVVDVSNPSKPICIQSIYNAVGQTKNDVYVKNQMLYIAGSTEYIIFDVSNPYAFDFEGSDYDHHCIAAYGTGKIGYFTWTTQYGSSNLFGFTAVLASGGRIFDVNNFYIGVPKADPSTTPTSIQVEGKYAYFTLSGNMRSLMIVDVSNRYSMFLVGRYDTEYGVNEVYVEGDYAYLADGPGGLVILSLKPLPPVPTPLSLSFSKDQQTLLLTTSGLTVNKQYHIEASTNMTQWTTWSIFNSSTSQVTIRVIPSQNAMRFYRAVQVP